MHKTPILILLLILACEDHQTGFEVDKAADGESVSMVLDLDIGFINPGEAIECLSSGNSELLRAGSLELEAEVSKCFISIEQVYGYLLDEYLTFKLESSQTQCEGMFFNRPKTAIHYNIEEPLSFDDDCRWYYYGCDPFISNLCGEENWPPKDETKHRYIDCIDWCDANAICEQENMRLCSRSELMSTCEQINHSNYADIYEMTDVPGVYFHRNSCSFIEDSFYKEGYGDFITSKYSYFLNLTTRCCKNRDTLVP